MSVEWSPELTLNHEVLDQQHVDLFRRLGDASAAIDGARESFDAAVDSFGDALVAHLAFEEQLMEETRYPERVRHKSAHEMFVADFEQMRAEARANGPTPAVAGWIRQRIPEWLRFHIRVNDAPFGAHLARLRKAQPGDAKVRGKDGSRRLS